MSERLKPWAVPAYLFACLLLGGSPQGHWGALALQLGGLALIAWAGLSHRTEPLSRAARWLALLAAAAVMLILLQLVPLPPAVWSSLPGRQAVADGYGLLGEPLPWLPLSLAPYATLDSLLYLIPPLAIFAGVLRLGAYRSRYIAFALLGGAALGILLGAVQVTTGSGYLYRLVTRGVATGFFANASYMGTLLLVAIPMIATFIKPGGRGEGRGGRAGMIGIMASMLLLVVIGITLSRSLAALLLMVPVTLVSLLVIATRKQQPRGWLLGAAAAAGLLAVAGVTLLPATGSAENVTSLTERRQIYRVSLEAAKAVMPVGSGFGSFVPVYARQEANDAPDRTFVNHAHNEYLEFAMEGGLPAILLMLLGLGWWVRRSWSIWRSPAASAMARAATIGSAAILLHSLVDFPARTLAISATLATCLALMAEPRPRRLTSERTLQRPARHLTL